MELDDFLEKAYDEVNDNVKFSEAKNAALITLNSALITWGGSIVFDSSISFVYRALVSIFVLLLIIPLLCSIISFSATTGSPKGIAKKLFEYLKTHNDIPAVPEKNMFYAYIHKYYSAPEMYLDAIRIAEMTSEEKPFLLQIAQQIIDLAGVAYKKSILFNIAVKIECLIFSLGGVSALIILFAKYVNRIA